MIYVSLHKEDKHMKEAIIRMILKNIAIVILGAPLNFVTNQQEKYVYNQEGNIDKKYYELAAFTELKNAIRSGYISIVGNKQHKAFEEYLMTDDE